MSDEGFRREQCAEPERFRSFFERSGELEVLARKAWLTVWQSPDGVVYKHYRIEDLARRRSRPWEREWAALRALGGRSSPRGFGYLWRPQGNGVEVVLAKEFLPGRHVTSFASAQCAALALALADIHGAGVTVEDPRAKNFVEDRGRFWAIDLDWARVYRSRIWHRFKVGKELSNVRCRVLVGDPSGWAAFLRAYRAASPSGPAGRALEWLGDGWWTARSRLRERRGRSRG